MNIESRIREIRQLIGEAERCRGECHYQSKEAAALEHIIAALQALLSLVRSLAPFLPKEGA